MSNENKVRLAHEVLDGLSAGRILSRENEQLLRSFLPELPKQKTLEEITEHVRNAWVGTSGNDWAGNSYNREIALESWMGELYVQLQGLKDTPATVPALPAGMRIADHESYGRVVVSPGLIPDGRYQIFVLDSGTKTGAECEFVHPDTLTFIDDAPAKSAHPEFLETEADYRDAPEGTIVAWEGSLPWHKFDSAWLSTAAYEGNNAKNMTGIIRRVLRWGDGE